MQTITPATLADELVAATPPLTEQRQHLAINLYRLLAEGQPVQVSVLADRSGVPSAEVDQALGEWRSLFTDEEDRVIGFLGLTIRPMPHRLTVARRTLYAWCAYDTLFLPELLGASAEVESKCPVTGEPITLTVSSTEIMNQRPADTVLSFLHRDEAIDENVIKTFCHYVHFFANPAAAGEWTAEHDGTFTISLADAGEIARHVNRARYPDIFTD